MVKAVMEAQIREIIISRNDVRIVFEESSDGPLRTKRVSLAELQRHPDVGPFVDEVSQAAHRLLVQLDKAGLENLPADENPPRSE